jgi:hypothetical protein
MAQITLMSQMGLGRLHGVNLRDLRNQRHLRRLLEDAMDLTL